MPPSSYWLNLYTWKTWNEFLAAGGKVTGFRETRWTTAQKIRRGDYLICYLTGVSRWIGLQKVIGSAFRDSTSIWEDNNFPVRVPVETLIRLTPETAVPILSLRDQLSFFENLPNPHAWTGWLRSSPAHWKRTDGEAVRRAIEIAEKDPIIRPVDPVKLRKTPSILRAPGGGNVTVPDAEAEIDCTLATQPTPPSPRDDLNGEATAHTEIQWLLAKLGSDMGLRIWIARNDRGREYRRMKFADLPNLIRELPVQFDEATRRTIELIDVLWLRGQAIVAAFEIESTTSVYSGLLRMSDLISMQPNISMPLYIVAPDDRREKVMTEINRPTFRRLGTPLPDICRYIPFEILRQNIDRASAFVRHLSPQFLDDFAEVCDPGDI